MDIKLQYEFVVSSRGVLIDFCRNLNELDFIVENSNFGRGSIRNLLVHIGNTYEFWIGKHALKKIMNIKEYSAIKSVNEAEKYFEQVNDLIKEFISVFQNQYNEELNIIMSDKTINVTPLKSFTHVITHEFHHKGQILSFCRYLGYTPVDTDIIR